MADTPTTLFEWPPKAFAKRFEALLPIMARLPTTDREKNDHDTSTETYLRPGPNEHIIGTLSYDAANEGLTYTLSRLPKIDEASRDMWVALHSLRPLSNNYSGDTGNPPGHDRPTNVVRKCPFSTSKSRSESTALTLVRNLFNWTSLRLPAETSGIFYGVVFRSKRAPGSESTNLYQADKLAHEEAVTSGGLLMYFYGSPDPDTGVNLATCVWSSRDDARIASRLPMHRLAVEHARKAYAWFELERYAVVKRQGEEGVVIEAWDEGAD